MKIAVQTGGLEPLYGVMGTYLAVKEAGFDAVDANLNGLLSYQAIVKREIDTEGSVFRTGLSEKDFLDHFRPWKEGADKALI